MVLYCSQTDLFEFQVSIVHTFRYLKYAHTAPSIFGIIYLFLSTIKVVHMISMSLPPINCAFSTFYAIYNYDRSNRMVQFDIPKWTNYWKNGEKTGAIYFRWKTLCIIFFVPKNSILHILFYFNQCLVLKNEKKNKKIYLKRMLISTGQYNQ